MFYGDFLAIIAQVLGIEAARRTIMQEIKVTSPGDNVLGRGHGVMGMQKSCFFFIVIYSDFMDFL